MRGRMLNQGPWVTEGEGRHHLFPGEQMAPMVKVCCTEDQGGLVKGGLVIVTLSYSLVLLLTPSFLQQALLSAHCLGLDKMPNLNKYPSTSHRSVFKKRNAPVSHQQPILFLYMQLKNLFIKKNELINRHFTILQGLGVNPCRHLKPSHPFLLCH